MAVEPGLLRHRITIQELVEIDDSYGQPTQSWEDKYDTWSEIRTPTTVELISAERLNILLSHVVTIRYDPSIDQTMQLVYEGRVLRINSVSDPEERKRTMVLKCTEPASIPLGDTEFI